MKTKTVYLSSKANPLLIDYISELKNNSEINDYELIFPHADIDEAISCHPDEYLCSFGSEIYVGNPEKLSPEYPQDVLYNAAKIGNYLICSKFTSPDLIEKSRLTPIVVPQGYVKCNCLVLDDKHLITEDSGIYEILSAYNDINCILINPHEVDLPGFKYGFIGGSAGRINRTIVFNGDISVHSNYKQIKELIYDIGLNIKYFKSYKLTDIGSIITDFTEF